MTYTQLTQGERYRIAALLETQHAAAAIAKLMNRSPTTIRAELRRGRSTPMAAYCPDTAQLRALARKANNAQRLDDALWQQVRPLLAEQWSPEQIAGRLTAEQGGKAQLSHVSIYHWIARDKRAGGVLFQHLRHGKPYRRRHTKDTRGKIVGRRDIMERPGIVEERGRIGDWELDLVIGGQHKGALITLNERLSGLSLQRWIPSKEADKVAVGVIHLLSPLKAFVHTITSDNGLEFSRHAFIAEALQADFFFARPYASWQRGSNENINGLIRQYFPKGVPLDRVKEFEVAYSMRQLNHRPRKRHGYKTPIEVFTERTGMNYSLANGFTIQ
ncbi:IS30 family transposase [Chitinimonas sp. BJB300]|uniref:IS30 family transposase n=2 Tax=Chitinimonas sp. BJB300 TaxID=1559339 RepID=UPI00111268F1|nr:IS30 family transposase [Chitinimonas sp. BJB300]TSJ91461.1 IS30 family transposase [Chitinimonas sp. BJB300]